MSSPADIYFLELKKWKIELQAIREIFLATELKEEIKWKAPCYTLNGDNIAIIHGFKSYCAISFFKGSLLKDKQKILIQPTENTQAGRQIRISSIEEVLTQKSIIEDYIKEAIKIEEKGLKIEFKPLPEVTMPIEFAERLQKDAELNACFNALTPGRKKAYLLFFSSAKQSKTIEDRINKFEKRIKKGKGITDCICGLSKKMPSCDGSHRVLKNLPY